jgi:hypothetical protein
MSRTPDFRELERMRAECKANGRWQCWWSGATYMHPNPRFYKYYWWVSCKESPVDGRQFLSTEYRLCTADAMQLLDRLKEQNEPCWLYNTRLPRMDKAHVPFPLNPDSERWRDAEWAPAYDGDPDPAWNGFK